MDSIEKKSSTRINLESIKNNDSNGSPSNSGLTSPFLSPKQNHVDKTSIRDSPNIYNHTGVTDTSSMVAKQEPALDLIIESKQNNSNGKFKSLKERIEELKKNTSVSNIKKTIENFETDNINTRSNSISMDINNIKSSNMTNRKSVIQLEKDFIIKNDTPIDKIIIYLVHNNLKQTDIDCQKWIDIMNENLIKNYEILTRQEISIINQLDLPAGLRNEFIKMINSELNSNKTNNNYHHVTINSDIKQKMKKSWEFILNDETNRNKFYYEYNKLYCEAANMSTSDMDNLTTLQRKSKKIGAIVGIILKYTGNASAIENEINNLALYKIIEDSENKKTEIHYKILAGIIRDSVNNTLKEKIDAETCEGWQRVSKIVFELIQFKAQRIKKEQNLFDSYFYYRHKKEWKKCTFMINVHKNTLLEISKKRGDTSATPLSNIVNKRIISINKADEFQTNFKRQNEFCFQFVMEDDREIYVCAKNKSDYYQIYNILSNILKIYEEFKK